MSTFLRLLLLLCCLLACLLPACCDTGTYEILNYQVLLTPHADGNVQIDYDQHWKVTGGHIPWVTIGTPNKDYSILSFAAQVKSASDASEGDWSGVRLDLNRDFQPGDTFEVRVSIKQTHLFFADEKNYHLDFTPGWYDAATISAMEVRLKSFAPLASITSKPQPGSSTEDELVWTRKQLSAGEHFDISVSFPRASIPQAIPPNNLRPEGNGADIAGPIFVFVIFAIFIIIVIVAIIRSATLRGAGYTGGGIFYGGGGIGSSSSRDSSDSTRPPRTGGGGGFGGSGFSCACACVSCACACACAGGGGAGCSRKRQHSCPICQGRK